MPSGDQGAGWEASFVATQVAIGVPLAEAVAALGDRTPPPEIAHGLGAGERAARAKTLAAAVHAIVRAVEEAELR
jgi:hypothetical protein